MPCSDMVHAAVLAAADCPQVTKQCLWPHFRALLCRWQVNAYAGHMLITSQLLHGMQHC